MRSTPLIMIAEDNPSLRKMLSMVLRRSGYAVVEAVNGREAVELADRDRPDLLVLDIRMPEMNGIEALRRIHGTPELSGTPAIMLTALSQRSKVLAAAEAGAFDYIVKSGFDLKTFLAGIRGMLSRREEQVSRDEGPPRPSSRREPCSATESAGRAGLSATVSPPARSTPTQSRPSDRKKATAAMLRDAGDMPELANHVPPISHFELADRVRHIAGVKALPFVIPRVLALTGSQYSSAEQLVSAIEPDVALTSRVLSIANSSFYRRRDPVINLRQAVKNIGFGSVRQAALGLGLMDLFTSQPDRRGIDRLRFWEHSLASAMIARILAARAHMDEPRAFIVGLLHDLGRLIEDEFFNEHYTRLLQFYDSEQLLPSDLERRWMGLDQAQLAKAVMREWKIPAELYRPIGDHRLPLATLLNKVEPRRRWAGLVKTADHLATCLGLGDSRAQQIGHLDDELVDDFGINDGLLEDLRDCVPNQLHELKMAMLLYMPRACLSRPRCPVSERPLIYLSLRPCRLDIVEYYLRLRHTHVETFSSAEAFAARLRAPEPEALAVINLLPSPAFDRSLDGLHQWIRQLSKPDDVPGLILARTDQTDRLRGPLGRTFRGLLSPVSACQLDRFLGLRRPAGGGK